MTIGERSCATCQWWHNAVPQLATGMVRPKGADAHLGTCHASPPTLARGANFTTSLFPETHHSRYCASWTPEDQVEGPDGGEELSPDTGRVVPFGRKAA